MKSKLALFIVLISLSVISVHADFIQLNDTDNVADVWANDGTLFASQFQTRWNLSRIPTNKTIEEAKLCMYIITGGTASATANVSRVLNYNWTDSSPLITVFNSAGLDLNQTQIWSSTTISTWSCINITNVLNTDYVNKNNFTTFRFKDSSSDYSNTPTAVYNSDLRYGTFANERYFTQRTGTVGQRPYINITYSASVTPNNPPVINNVKINSTFGTNLTTENLTVYWNATDPDSNPVYNITDWRKNNVSLAMINMPFEADGKDNATDYSTYKNNGKYDFVTGDATLVNGYRGKAYQFNDLYGTRITINESVYTPNTMTVSAWINSSISNTQFIYSKNDPVTSTPLVFYVNSDGKVRFGKWVNTNSFVGAISTTTINTNTWYHVAGRYNGTDYQVFVNGVLENSTTSTRDADNNCASSIGLLAFTCTGAGASGLRFKGIIDEFMLFNNSVSDNYISQLATSTGNTFIQSNKLVAGDNWTSCVTPSDGIINGSTVCSNQITILAPIVPDVDGDGFNSTLYGGLDCNDNNANVIPPTNSYYLNRSVTLCSGTYTLPTGFYINSSNIVLSGNNTVINGSVLGIYANGKNNITIHDINITSSSNGLNINNLNKLNAYNINVNSASYGIYLFNVGNATLNNNRFISCQYGISTLGTSPNTNIINNYVNNASVIGIAVGYGGEKIYNNLVVSSVNGAGITPVQANDVQIYNNTILNVKYGVQLSSSVRNLIYNNTISGSSTYGIDFESNSVNNTVYSNILNNNGLYDIFSHGLYSNSFNFSSSSSTIYFDKKPLDLIDVDNIYVSDSIVGINTSIETGANYSANVVIHSSDLSCSNYTLRYNSSYFNSLISARATNSPISPISTSCTGSANNIDVSFVAPSWSTYYLSAQNDVDGDGFYTDFAPIDCNDNDYNVVPPSDTYLMNRSLTFCSGTYTLTNNMLAFNSNVVLRGNNTVLVNNGIVMDNVQNVTITGFNFSSNFFALSGTSVANSYIHDNNFYGTTAVSIFLLTSNTTRIYNNNMFSSSAWGIALSTNRDMIVENNTMNLNGLYDASIEFSYNTSIFNNNLNGAGRNLRLYNSDLGIVENNTLTNGVNGINIDGASNYTINKNTWSGNTKDISSFTSTLNNLHIRNGLNTLTFTDKVLNVTSMNNLFVNDSIVAVDIANEPQMNVSADISFQVPSCSYTLLRNPQFYTNIQQARAGLLTYPNYTSYSCVGNTLSFTSGDFPTMFVATPPFIIEVYSPQTTNILNNETPKNITFYGNATDDDDNVLTFTWKLNNAVQSTSSVTKSGGQFYGSHNQIFTTDGNYDVTLDINDSSSTASYTWNVYVSPPPPPPASVLMTNLILGLVIVFYLLGVGVFAFKLITKGGSVVFNMTIIIIALALIPLIVDLVKNLIG